MNWNTDSRWSLKEASQTRDYCVAKNATRRAARLDPSLRKKRLLRMTIKLQYYQCCPGRAEAFILGSHPRQPHPR